MRKLNAIVTILIMVFFVIHGIAGGFQLMGVIPGGNSTLTVLAWIMASLIGIHFLIGVKLTADSLIAVKRSGRGYLKDNKLFWIRRVSGFALMVFVIVHMILFMGTGSGSAYRLSFFGAAQLTAQILMVASLAVHIISNIVPSMISLGAKGIKSWAVDVLLVTAVVLAFTAVGFVIYFIRWNTL